MKESTQTQSATFSSLGIAPAILDVLAKLSYTNPTPIQMQAIPAAIEGKDVVGIAQTGTGKTLAFGIPAIQQLIQNPKGGGLIVVPTRELALQADEVFAKVGRPLGIRTAVLIGGAAMGPQLGALRRNPHVIIATPGRLLDHLEQKTLTLKSVNILVLDEADRMLDMGFWPQVKRIIAAAPTERQTMLFSATLSREIMDLAQKHMKTPFRIEVAPSGTTAERVSQEFFIVRKEDKIRLLEKILSDYHGPVIVFARTKHGATRIAKQIARMGHASADIHGDRSLAQRTRAIEGFKTGKYRVLVATDIAARGIDVKGIELVVNYDLPTVAEDYVHRIGRTARAGAEGHAISFAMPMERREMRSIERLIRKALPVSRLPELPPPRTQPAEQRTSYEAPRQGQRGRHSRGFSGHKSGRPFKRRSR